MDTREANHLNFIISMLERNGETETAEALKSDGADDEKERGG